MWKPSNKQQLIEDHQNRVPLRQLAFKHKGSVDQIRSFLQAHHAWIPYKQYKQSLNPTAVIELYKQDFTPTQIAEQFNCSIKPITDILDQHNVRKPVWAKQLTYQTYQQVSDYQTFKQACEQLISKKNIAQHFGIRYDMVVSLCKRHSITLPNSAQCRSLIKQQHSGYVFDKNTVYNLHIEQHKSLADIADMLNISVNYLRKKIKEWNIPTLPQGKVRLSDEFRDLSNDIDYLRELVEQQHVSMKTLQEQYKVSHETLTRLIKQHDIVIPTKYRSDGEKQIEHHVQSCVPESTVYSCDRTLIWPYELDLYIPEHKLAIEYCGLYWHSELNGKDHKYHLNKQQRCQNYGVQLLTIFEDEFQQKPEIVYNKIEQCLGHSQASKINARQCYIQPITTPVKDNFLHQNHLQGADVSNVKLGLFANDDHLVAVMTFAKPSRVRSSVKIQHTEGVWELNRFVTDQYYQVRGAASKLLEYFKRNYNWVQLYSYADKRWSQGKLYQILGFVHESDTKPNYWYLPKGYYKREYRYNYAKYKLVEQGFDPKLTEKQIMEHRGFTRIWDCGHYKYVLYNKN